MYSEKIPECQLLLPWGLLASERDCPPEPLSFNQVLPGAADCLSVCTAAELWADHTETGSQAWWFPREATRCYQVLKPHDSHSASGTAALSNQKTKIYPLWWNLSHHKCLESHCISYCGPLRNNGPPCNSIALHRYRGKGHRATSWTK